MNRVNLRIVEKLRPLIEKPKRIKLIVGSRGSAKSVGVSDIMLMFADKGERICCAREFLNSIDDSVHETLRQEIERLGAKGFRVLNNRIYTANGGEIFHKGLARNVTSLKSLAGVNRLLIEEGETVSEKSLRILTPSIRSSAGSNEQGEDPPEIWIIMNRGSRKDAIARKYLARAEKQLAKTGYYEDDMVMVIQVNWQDNPWFPPELEQERQDDLKNLSPAEYRHVWGGDYYDEVKNSIIPVEWFDAAIDAHIKLGFKPRGAKIAAFDPSDTGDAKGYALRHGSVILKVLERKKGDVNDGCDWAMFNAIDDGADFFTWDCDGMGVSLKRQVNEWMVGKKIDLLMFKGSETPDDPNTKYQPQPGDLIKKAKTNRQTFKNKRAQYYWRLRDRFYATYRAVSKTPHEYIDPDELISLSSEIEDLDSLRAEICRIPRKPNNNGLIQMMSKEDMLKLGIDSPNMADPVMMSMMIPRITAPSAPMQFDSLWN